MAYTVFLKREPPLTLDEWNTAVTTTDQVRLDANDVSVTNPKTGEGIAIGGSDGNAQAYLDGVWYPCFFWFESRVIFRGSHEFDDPNSPFGLIVHTLAQKLGAQIVDEYGKVFV